LAIKAPVRVATTANITLSGLQTIDGVTVVADDRVLVKDQTSGVDNGIYVASSSAWQRDEDFDGSYDVVQGTLISVSSGTLSGGAIYKLTTSSPVIGTTTLSFALANDLALEGNLAAASGAALVGSDDGNSGSDWTTVAGAISHIDAAKVETADIGITVQPIDALLTSLAGQTVAANKVQAYSAADTASLLDFKDEDDMASNSATAVPSQQSVKAYVDTTTSAIHTLTRGTAQAATSGTAIDFTGIPSWARKLTVAFNEVSTNATGDYLFQLGTSGGVETTGYISSSEYGGAGVSSTSAFVVQNGSSTGTSGYITFFNITGNVWVGGGVFRPNNGTGTGGVVVGNKELSGTLDRVHITGSGDTFDAGSINIFYE
jgi:hypothetical protein